MKVKFNFFSTALKVGSFAIGTTGLATDGISAADLLKCVATVSCDLAGNCKDGGAEVDIVTNEIFIEYVRVGQVLEPVAYQALDQLGNLVPNFRMATWRFNERFSTLVLAKNLKFVLTEGSDLFRTANNSPMNTRVSSGSCEVGW